jgi:hypothetical protein
MSMQAYEQTELREETSSNQIMEDVKLLFDQRVDNRKHYIVK